MSIVRVTAYPSRYADEDWADDEQIVQEDVSVGKFYLRFDTVKTSGRYSPCAKRQRELAETLAIALGEKPVYTRRERYYTVGDWSVYASVMDETIAVSTGLFDIGSCEKTLLALDTLKQAGYAPDEEITIYFTPDVYDFKLIVNLCNIMEARKELLIQALGLSEDIKIIVDEDLAFGIPLNAFSFEKVEACVHLLRQASLMAANTGKARMKPCDGSNPKFQMRSWLLRLGFIGDTFARPRQTLLGGLAGDGAFFSDAGKEKAAVKRKAKRMADGVMVS
jgi:hypothetical protein